MNYKIATREEIEKVFNEHMKKDFPPDELKPLASIMQAYEKGWYKMYLAYDEDGIKGYACVADCSNKIGFLDYFAIVDGFRGTGLGSVFFRKVGELSGFECIILETESIESSKCEEEVKTRKRRIAFYKRLGCVDTGIMYNVFGVEYNVMINRNMPLTEDFLSRLLSAYEYAYAAILLRNDKSYIYRVK
ncbi:MAG: GNAT family N-acetyltransferase [Clostridia bacterium]|nr:GNAT family N-acetyltransferase [Clostridia bacterium]